MHTVWLLWICPWCTHAWDEHSWLNMFHADHTSVRLTQAQPTDIYKRQWSWPWEKGRQLTSLFVKHASTHFLLLLYSGLVETALVFRRFQVWFPPGSLWLRPLTASYKQTCFHPLTWAQWISSKNIRLVFRRSQVWYLALWTLSLSLSLSLSHTHTSASYNWWSPITGYEWPRVRILVCVHVRGM